MSANNKSRFTSHTKLYTVKYIRISIDILWRVFNILTELVSYTFVSVNQRNNEIPASRILMWAQASLFRRFTGTNVYETGFVKIWESRHKISVDIPVFLQWRGLRPFTLAVTDVASDSTYQYPCTLFATRYYILLYNDFTAGRDAKFCDEYVCLSVCRQAYLTNHLTGLHEFLCLSPVVAVARSSSDGVVVWYVLPVLWA